MPSQQDTNNRKQGSSESEAQYNYQIALLQGEKTAFRAHKTALNADPFNPNRVDNAVQQKLSEF